MSDVRCSFNADRFVGQSLFFSDVGRTKLTMINDTKLLLDMGMFENYENTVQTPFDSPEHCFVQQARRPFNQSSLSYCLAHCIGGNHCQFLCSVQASTYASFRLTRARVSRTSSPKFLLSLSLRQPLLVVASPKSRFRLMGNAFGLGKKIPTNFKTEPISFRGERHFHSASETEPTPFAIQLFFSTSGKNLWA